MPNIRTMMGGKFLKKEDVAQPVLVTIANVEQQQIKGEDGTEEKWVLTFPELDKGLVMNSTNLQLCALACGSEETEDWIGRKIVLFADPNVSMGGKLVGGIRIRAPKNRAAQPAPQPQPAKPQQPQGGHFDDLDSDIPF